MVIQLSYKIVTIAAALIQQLLPALASYSEHRYVWNSFAVDGMIAFVLPASGQSTQDNVLKEESAIVFLAKGGDALSCHT